MVKACKLRPVESRQKKKWDKQVYKEFSHEIIGCRYHKQLHKHVPWGASPVRVKGEGMIQLNGELVYVAWSPREILLTPDSFTHQWKQLGRCLSLHQAASVFSRVVQPWQNQKTYCSPGKQDSWKQRRVGEKPASKLSSSAFLSAGVIWIHSFPKSKLIARTFSLFLWSLTSKSVFFLPGEY